MADAKNPRRKARALALQILYEIDLANHSPAETLAAHLEHAALKPKMEQFVRDLVLGTLSHREEFDRVLGELAPDWPVAVMPTVDRNILRLSMYELQYRPKTPVSVAINEAVELARTFGTDSSRRFINGTLGTYAAQHVERDS